MELLKLLLHLLLSLLNPFVFIPIIIVIIVHIKKDKEYKECAYYQITKLPYLSVRHDAGRYGEYLTYKYLKHMEASGAKFLFNVYIPKENGETTEIDVLAICPKGIFVFESKNYSGWIFGSESQKNWYQTLPSGRGRSHKEQFYNPVMQNRSHIKHLKALLGETVPMWSIIVFSERCTLKNVQIQSADIRVVKRYDVAPAVSAICNQTPADLLAERSVSEIYEKLYPFSQADAAAKAQHIANIHTALNGSPAQPSPIIQPGVAPDAVAPAEPAAVSQDTAVVAVAETDVEVASSDPIPAPQQLPKCPRCNGELILRTATRGANAGNQFYGCSNYPKCRYIQNISKNQTTN